MTRQNSRRRARKTSRTADKVEKTATAATEIGSQLATTPLALMKRFGEEMDRVLGEFGLGRGWLNSVAGGELGDNLWTPPVEMFERDGQLVVRADLPGLTREDVNVELDEGGITIEGERRGEKEETRKGFYRSERSFGKFLRRLPLPEGVKVEEANATFNNGVLEITMAARRPKETKARRLSIRDESKPQAKRKAA